VKFVQYEATAFVVFFVASLRMTSKKFP